MISFVSDIVQLIVVLIGLVSDVLSVKGSSEQHWFIVLALAAIALII